jgi:hypothetical protein
MPNKYIFNHDSSKALDKLASKNFVFKFRITKESIIIIVSAIIICTNTLFIGFMIAKVIQQRLLADRTNQKIFNILCKIFVTFQVM